MVGFAQILGDHPLLAYLVLYALISLALGAMLLFVHWSRRHRERMRKTRIEYLFVHDLIGLAVALCLLLFISLAITWSGDGRLPAADLALANGLHRATDLSLIPAIKAFTFFGDGIPLATIGVGVGIGLLLRKKIILALGWGAAVGGGALLNYALKAGFQRPRPYFTDPTVVASGWSFPSGHSMGTMVTVGMLVYLAFTVIKDRRARVATVIFALAWTAGIGWSRMVLGAHYMTDVLAGFAAGAVWLSACVSGLEVARRRPVVPA